MKTIFLKIGNKQIYYNETEFIPVEKTNLPHGDMRFNTEYKDIYWEVRIKKFDNENEELFVDVTDYYPNVGKVFQDQKCKRPFKLIHFEPLDWQKVEPQLSSYTELKIKNHFFGITSGQRIKSAESFCPTYSSAPSQLDEVEAENEVETENEVIPIKEHKPAELTRSIEVVLRISINDFTFHEGFASTSKKLITYGYPVKIVIHNPIFHKEFEYIKDYFIRFFKHKTVKVYITYGIKSEKITELRCKCPDLEGIDESIIENIKIKRTNILRKPSLKETKSILDLDEVFQVMNDPSAGKNVFNQSEEELINHFMNIDGIRNKQQLSYLANDLQLREEKIRFTILPIFGFVFFYKTDYKSYSIWELLDSHATYIWYVEKSVMSKMSLFMELEKAIEYIKVLGREKYKQAYKEGLINATIQFISLYHKRNEASGFQYWRNNLKSIIEN